MHGIENTTALNDWLSYSVATLFYNGCEDEMYRGLFGAYLLWLQANALEVIGVTAYIIEMLGSKNPPKRVSVRRDD
ncbi:MAG: hypothetical protein Salg2KO_10850 [Salibacteraceae bacterium]